MNNMTGIVDGMTNLSGNYPGNDLSLGSDLSQLVGGSITEYKGTPKWLIALQKLGYKPYIATSNYLYPLIDETPFGLSPDCFVLENSNHASFLEAYRMSNSLSFENPGLKMPSWVLIDCVLLQTPIVGFMRKISDIPLDLLKHYQEASNIDLSKMEYLPVTGQIASLGLDGKSLVGFSLFSLRSRLDGPKGLGLCTKALAFEVYRSLGYKQFYGIAQYDNWSVRIHGRFARYMEIHQPIVHVHPCKDMTFIYKMELDYDPYYLDRNKYLNSAEMQEPTFWMNAKDIDAKQRIEKSIQEGKKYIIAPPYLVKRDGELFLPIIEKQGEF